MKTSRGRFGSTPPPTIPCSATPTPNFARLGLSFQRSQNSGRYVPSVGPAPAYFVRLAGRATMRRRRSAASSTASTRRGAVSTARSASRRRRAAEAALVAIDREVVAAKQAFALTDPSASAPALARGLAALRAARQQLGSNPEIAHVLALKEPQFVAALAAAIGLEVSAIAVPTGTPEPSGPFAAFAPAATMPAPVPGQTLRRACVGGEPIDGRRRATRDARDGGGAGVERRRRSGTRAVRRRPAVHRDRAGDPAGRCAADVSAGAPRRRSPTIATRRVPWPRRRCRWRWSWRSAASRSTCRSPVRRRDNQQPYGYALRELAILPELAVSVSPRQALLPSRAPGHTLSVTVEVTEQPADDRERRPRRWRPLRAGASSRRACRSSSRPAERARRPRSRSPPPAVGVGAYRDDRCRLGQWQDVQRGLRRARAPRSRDALLLPAVDREAWRRST